MSDGYFFLLLNMRHSHPPPVTPFPSRPGTFFSPAPDSPSTRLPPPAWTVPTLESFLHPPLRVSFTFHSFPSPTPEHSFHPHWKVSCTLHSSPSPTLECSLHPHRKVSFTLHSSLPYPGVFTPSTPKRFPTPTPKYLHHPPRNVSLHLHRKRFPLPSTRYAPPDRFPASALETLRKKGRPYFPD